MSASYIGINSALTSEIVVEIKNDGLSTVTERKLVRGDLTVTTPNLGQTISIGGLGTCKAISVEQSKTDGSFTEQVIVYQAKSTDNTLIQDVLFGTSEEPIETNPNFLISTDLADSIVTFSGGEITEEQAQSGSGGAVFNQNKEFLYFNNKARGGLFGVTSYLNPSAVYKRVFTTNSVPDLSAVGRIVSAAADFPQIQSGKTWLCTGISYVLRGGTYQVTQEFRASDKNGWNVYIYGSAISAPTYT